MIKEDEKMPTNAELRSIQTDKLYDLLKLRLDNEDAKVKGLDEIINKTRASMSQEDVAWVEKTLAELYK
jgi:hypothetical protein